VWLGLDGPDGLMATPADTLAGGVGAVLAGARAGWEAFAARSTTRLTGTVEWLCPLDRPGKLLAVGLNYRDHARETGGPIPPSPAWFMKPDTTLAAPISRLAHPGFDDTLDYEGELAVVIGQGGRNLGIEAVGAYAVANDITLRSLAKPETLPLAKGLDGALPLGPGLTPAWAVPDPQGLRIQTWVNGALRQNGTTADMITGVAALVAQVSRIMTLNPGDVIITGSPAGSGVGLSPPQYLQPGDSVRVEIEGLGAIETLIAPPHSNIANGD
jgi:2-keto-4-pentenoate hydratase/2-oxohepta-3-ene-1,7-dioic acid hydratase in catechol pathway